MAKAEAQRAAGRCEEAISEYDRIIPHASDARIQVSALDGKGVCLIAMDRGEDAFQTLQQALAIDPGDRIANLTVAELLISAQAPVQAAAFIRPVLSRDKNDARALADLGADHAAAGELAEAVDAYEKSLRIDPSNAAAAVALAEIYDQQNNVDAAGGVLRRATIANKTSATPWMALGRLAEESGDVPGAERDYRMAVKLEDEPRTNLRLAQFLQRTARVQEAEAVLERVDGMQHDSTALADFQLTSGRPIQSLLGYTSALREWLSHTPTRHANPEGRKAGAQLLARYVEAELQSAATATDLDTRNQTIASARALLKSNGELLAPVALDALEAEAALVEGDLKQAEDQADAALDLDRKSVPALLVKAEVAVQHGDSNRAKQFLQDALTADPANVPAELASAKIALAEQQNTTAEQYVVDVVRQEPANIDALTIYSRALLADHQPDAARVICRRAIAVNSSAVDSMVTLGEIELAEGHTSNAFLEFQRAVVTDPHDQRALQHLVDIYSRGRFTRPMLRKMEAIAGAAPVSPTLLEVAARLYARGGWKTDAVRAAKAALAADPHRMSAADFLAELEEAPPTLSQRQLEKAIQSGDPAGVAANNLAWDYANSGINLEKALELAESAHTRNPKRLEFSDTLGYVHLRRHEYSEAALVLRNTLDLLRLAPEADRERLAPIVNRHLAAALNAEGSTETDVRVRKHLRSGS